MTIDYRDLRTTYGAAERRIAPRGRRADDDGTGLVDSRLLGRVALEHREAEEAYFRALAGTAHGARVARLDGKAEGLALAVAVLSGIDVAEVRVRVAADSSERKRAGLDGVALARRSLEVGLS